MAVKTNAKEIVAELDKLPKQTRYVVSQSQNSTIRRLKKTEISKIVTESYNLSKERVNKGIKNRLSKIENLQASLVISQTAPGVVSFGAIQGFSGLRYQIKKGQTIRRHGFIQSISATPQAFARKGRGDALVGRYPIYRVLGISVPTMLEQSFTSSRLITETDKLLDKNMDKWAAKYLKETTKA
jgi:hypothetical protein